MVDIGAIISQPETEATQPRLRSYNGEGKAY